MKTKITKAWKDRSLRTSMNDLPSNPAGIIELDDTLLMHVNGGAPDVPSSKDERCWVSECPSSCNPKSVNSKFCLVERPHSVTQKKCHFEVARTFGPDALGNHC